MIRKEVVVSAEYFKARVDTFLATTTLKPRDYRPFRQTEEAKEKRRKKLIAAAKTNQELPD